MVHCTDLACTVQLLWRCGLVGPVWQSKLWSALLCLITEEQAAP